MELEKKIDAAIGPTADPVARMMLDALRYEVQKIEDEIDTLGDRVVERYCEDFIPRKQVEAMPALILVAPASPSPKTSGMQVGEGCLFSGRQEGRKRPVDFIPIFRTTLIPVSSLVWLTPDRFCSDGASRDIYMEQKNVLWVGLCPQDGWDSLCGFSLFFRGIKGVCPERILVGERELDFAPMSRMEDIKMAEPFDSQQASGRFFSFFDHWKEALMNLEEGTLVYLTDVVRDRDLFKPSSYPRVFQYWLESHVIDAIPGGLVWLKIVFPEGFRVPADAGVLPNVMPVVNVDVEQVMLTQTMPIAKLQKQEEASFIGVLETSNASEKLGFGRLSDEVIIRDFDASCYHDGDLYRDVRRLYNHFIEDYHAFIGYNGLKDGALLRQLRETVNKIGKGAGGPNARYRYDSGTYAMRNIGKDVSASPIRVSYLTTQGAAGNRFQTGDRLENKRMAVWGKEVQVVAQPACGRDKMAADERYEQLRYYALTQDRLYTKMDIDAFLRKEIMAAFGPEEFQRIAIRIRVEGTGGATGLERGLYVDLLFKDRKNYEQAVDTSFAPRMQQGILNKSCLSMPVMVGLVNLEG